MQRKVLNNETSKPQHTNLDFAAASSSCCLQLADLPSL